MNIKRLILPISFLLIVIFVLLVVSIKKEAYDKKPTLNVLMFHMVTKEMPDDEELNVLYITDEMFKRYCEFFKENYNIVSLDEAYALIKNNEEVDESNLLAFTFDDGYDNNYALAYPILKKNGIKANINIIAGYVDEKYPGYLTWEEIKEMSDSGLIDIGSHTYSSHYYTADKVDVSRPVLSAFLLGESNEERRERIFSDLKLADDVISRNIDKAINILAYPYGVPPFDLVSDIKDEFNYNIQLMVRPGINRTQKDFSELKRFTVDGSETPETINKRMVRYKGLDFWNGLKISFGR